METASSSSSSAYFSTTPGMDDAVALEGGQHAVRTKSLEEAAKQGPWWSQPRVLVILALVLMAGAGAGVVVALLTWDEGGGNGDQSSSTSIGGGGNGDSNGGGNDFSTPPPFVTASPPPTESPTESPTSFPTALVKTPTVSPTTAFPTEQPSFSPSASPAPSTSSPTADSIHEAFSFYVMGDIPYSVQQEYILESQMLKLQTTRASNSVFTVHVGDMQSPGRSNCQVEYFERTAELLIQNPLPTLVLAGDNDWLDCGDRATVGWQNYHDNFVDPPFEQYWLNSTTRTAPFPFEVTRNFQHRDMFSFAHEGVLFLSISIWASETRFEQANIAWVTDRIEHHFAQGSIRGVVVFGHGVRTHTNRGAFEGLMANFYDRYTQTYKRRVPVLYIHGDGHQWQIDTRFASNQRWYMYTDIQVDQGMAAPPILVEVAPSLDEETFVPLQQETQWQHVFGNGLFRIDRQGGRYDGSG